MIGALCIHVVPGELACVIPPIVPGALAFVMYLSPRLVGAAAREGDARMR